MTKAALKTKLRDAIGQVQDENVLEALYSVLYSHLHADEFEMSDEDKVMLDERVLRVESGKDKLHSWDEVKKLIRKKKRTK